MSETKETKTTWKPSLQEGWQDIDVSGLIMFGRPISGLVHFEETEEYIIAGFDKEDPLYMRYDKNAQEGAWTWVSDGDNKHEERYACVATTTNYKNCDTISSYEDSIVGDFFLALKNYADNKKGNHMETVTENNLAGVDNLKLPDRYKLLDFKREGDVVTVKVDHVRGFVGTVKYDYTTDSEWYQWEPKETLSVESCVRRSRHTLSGPVAQAIKDMIDTEKEGYQGDSEEYGNFEKVTFIDSVKATEDELNILENYRSYKKLIKEIKELEKEIETKTEQAEKIISLIEDTLKKEQNK